MIRSIVSLLVVSLALVTACDRQRDAADADAGALARATSASRTGSCDRVTSVGTCSEYGGSYLAQNEMMLTSTCQKLGGVFVYAACPNTSVLGTCALSTGEQRKFYASGAASYDAARAKQECEGPLYSGTWAELR